MRAAGNRLPPTRSWINETTWGVAVTWDAQGGADGTGRPGDAGGSGAPGGFGETGGTSGTGGTGGYGAPGSSDGTGGPAAPGGYGSPPAGYGGYGGYGGTGGFGGPGVFVPPPPPTSPPRGPADPLRAVAVALLNLSGLGLGYLVMRRWLAMIVCWIATGILLVVALPADPDGVSGGAVTAYAAFLVLAAVHGGLRGRYTRLTWPPLAPVAALLGLVLLAVPAGGVIYYQGAKDDATQKMLLDRLATADRLVRTAGSKPFSAAQPDYRSALSAYRDLSDKHAGSKAAKRVPASLKTYYTTVAAPYDEKDYCGAITPLKYLRTVPDSIGKKTVGSLATWPDDRLATSLYECGSVDLANNGTTASGGDENDLGELLATFPQSPQAAKVEPAVSSTIDKTAKSLKGSDPCTANDRLHGLGSFATTLAGNQSAASAALTKDAQRANGYQESGTYACGISQYKHGDFDTATTTMNDFADTYPHDKNASYAKKVAIAAEIAQDDAGAGKHLPSKASGGGISITVSNDSPDTVEILYTGTVTGSFKLKGCSGCTTYSSDALARLSACKDTSKHYSKKTISLPPGTVYFLHKPAGDDTTTTANSDSEKLSYGYIYTECAYTVSTFGY